MSNKTLCLQAPEKAEGQDRDSLMCADLEAYLEHHFNLSQRIEAHKNRKQWSCELDLVNVCNWSCSYCYTTANSSKDRLDVQQLKQIIDDLHAYGIGEIGWIGGEPLLYQGIEELMEYTQARGIQQALYSNATLLDKKWEPVLKYIDRCLFHVDSIRYEVWANTQIQPSRKTFERYMRNIPELIERGFDRTRIIICTPLTRPNYECLEETIDWTVDLGIENSSLIPLTPLGRSNDMEKFITPDEIRQAMQMRADKHNKPWLIELGPCEFCKQFQATDFTINYQGNVRPYADDYRHVGNVLKEPLLEILEREAQVLGLHDYVTEDSLGNTIPFCSECEYRKYCFGNVVSRKHPTPDRPDEDCWLVDQNYKGKATFLGAA